MKIEIDLEKYPDIAVDIVIADLKWMLEILKDNLKNPESVHPDDLEMAKEVAPALEIVLKYYGG